MSKEYPVSTPAALQSEEQCKFCAFSGKDIVSHYVVCHPSSEMPVHLAKKELLSLKNKASVPTSGSNEDRENILLGFLKNLGSETTFSSPVECPLCSYSTTSRSDMMNHLLIHQNVSFVCFFCPATETNLNDFRDHVSTHTGEYAYQCIHCNYKGAHSNDVGKHIISAHPGKEAKTIVDNVAQTDGDILKGYACNTCGFIQLSKVTVENHVASVETLCRGSSVIEFDLSRGSSVAAKSALNSSTDVGEGQSNNANRVYIQDEIEIAPNEPSASDSILPYSDDPNRGWNPDMRIKMEKFDPGYNKHSVTNSTPASVARNNPVNSPSLNSTPAAPVTPSIPRNVQSSAEASNDRPFVCASCQFSTIDEAEFIKHARTDHRTDLSLWCKSCGKCFSNAGVLVSHIKEGNCEKEEMIYRCGVKECTFETQSGQTFVHHLRHCHKGSPFIFCVHCQKIFTLPHCLILHMQNDCPFKNKNRRNQVDSNVTTTNNNNGSNNSNAVMPTPPPTPPVAAAVAKQITPRPNVVSAVSAAKLAAQVKSQPGKRGRPKSGAGRGRVSNAKATKFVVSESDSDPDDPSWDPEEVEGRPVRRSARITKTRNSENYSTFTNKPNEVPTLDASRKEEFLTQAIHCPCCDFSTLSRTLLEDHYVSEHKKPDKNQCNHCTVKFETISAFTEHFETLHRKNIVLPTNSMVGAVSPVMPVLQSVSVLTVSPAVSPMPEIHSVASQSAIPSGVMETGEGDVNVNKEKTTTPAESEVTIPYQAALHEKNQKDSKLKDFQDLKAPNDVVKMKEELKLKHFFKCMLWNCSFTTDNSSFFISHLNDNHNSNKLFCIFCFKEFLAAKPLTNHMLHAHGKRCYQCSTCFYRAFSKPHVQVHIKHCHSKDTSVVYTSTTHLTNDMPSPEEKEVEAKVVQTTWPYYCAIGECNFNTFDPKDFKKHNEVSHRSVTVFICHYCKAEFISFKRLMNHYRLHGINNFQCTYCLHGSDTKDEILLHLSHSHADKAFQIHVRAPQEGPYIKGPKANKSSLNEKESLKDTAAGMSNTRIHPKNVDPVDSSSEVSMQSVSVEKIKKERDREACVFEKIYPLHIVDFEYKFSCGVPTCNKQLEEIDVYLKHLTHNHMAINIICPYCLDVAESELDFKNHLYHHGPNLYACNDKNCCFSDWEKEKVVKHMKTCHHGGKNEVVTVREKGLNSTSAMKIPDISCPEQKNVIENLQEGFLCPFCNYKSQSRVMMKKHIYREFEYMRFGCAVCDHKFSCQNDIRLHFMAEHPNEDIKATLDLNAEIEHKVKAFLFCHQNVASRENLTSSALTAKTEPVIFCADCNKKFARARDWHQHLRLCLMQQFDAEVFEYVKCLECNATFHDLNQLKIHFSSMHLGKQLCFTEKPNRVEWMRELLLRLRLRYVEHAVNNLIKLCNARLLAELFAWKTQCKLEAKMYKCFYCPFTNYFKFNLDRHLAASHSGKPIKIERLTSMVVGLSDQEAKSTRKVVTSTTYYCIVCLKALTSVDSLKNHLETSHLEYPYENEYFLCASPSDTAFMEDKQSLFECIYCNSGRKIFSNMKLHYEKLHPTSEFKIKGFFNCSSKRKRDDEGQSDMQPAKKAKVSSDVFECWHCTNSFVSLDEIGAHCHLIHPCLPIKYKSKPNKGGNTAERVSKLINLSALGQNIDSTCDSLETRRGPITKFSCKQCGVAFKLSTQLEQHIASQHGPNYTISRKMDDLDKITVCVERKDMVTMRLSALYFSKTFDIFPRVQLEKILGDISHQETDM